MINLVWGTQNEKWLCQDGPYGSHSRIKKQSKEICVVILQELVGDPNLAYIKS